MNETTADQSMPSESTEPKRMSGNKIVIPSIVLIIIISIVTYIVRVSIGGDRENHYVRASFDLVYNYVEYSKGEWPRSWEDLEKMPAQNAWYEPLNYDKAKEIVIIDFKATKQEIASQKPETFTAIRPVKPIFRYEHDPRIMRLLEKLNESTSK